MIENLLERAKAYLAANPDAGRYKLGKALGIGDKKARNILKKIRRFNGADAPQIPQGQPSDKREGLTWEESSTSGCATSVSSNIRTLDDLLNYAQVDRSVWEVERHIVNKWDMGYKDANKEAQTQPLYQIKAWLKRRVVVQQTKQIISEMLAAFKDEAPTLTAPARRVSKDGCLLEISIFDLHLGKLCWGPECGSNYDSKIAQAGFSEALETLVKRATAFDVERILFPVGNDFFNVDNSAQTTTAGTPQREDGRWQKSFVAGRKLLVDAIVRLRELAPVDVLVIPGNHDTERMFYLGDTLAGWLSKTDEVTVNNEPTFRKYYAYGKNLLGFTHGKEEKHLNLPLIMATEVPQMWADSKFREFHVGHWHHKRDIHFQPTQEHNGIRVRLIPSLCPADDWHRMKGYDGLRAAEAYVWDREQGCVGSYSFSP